MKLMSRMDTVKQWIIGRNDQQLYMKNVVMTPKNIPAFTIPPRSDLSFRRKSESSDCNDGRSGSVSSGSSVNSTPCPHHPHNSSAHFVRSAPTSPNRLEKNYNFSLCQGGGNINDLSMAALSLSHGQSETKYGVSTIREKPNSRRRESLFHEGEIGSRSLRRHRSDTSPQFDLAKSLHNKKSEQECTLLRRFSHKRRNVPSLVAPLGVILSGQHNPEGNDVVRTPSIPSNSSASPERLRRSASHYYRRRSSLSVDDATMSRSVFPPDGASSNEASPINRRRSSATFLDPADKEYLSRIHQQRSISPVLSNYSTSPPSTCSCHSPSRESSSPFPADLGELKFSVQYFENSHQLRIQLIKAENLGGVHRHAEDTNPFVKLYVVPGKQCKQSSTIVRKTKNPVFNQDIFFDNLSLAELENMQLRMKVCSKTSTIKRVEVIGEINVMLDSFDLIRESRLWKDLEPRVNGEDLGEVQLTLSFQASSQKLVLTLEKLRLLSKRCLSGTSDPYIKIELQQPGRMAVKKCPKVRRSTSNVTIQEAFVFDISPKIEDLNLTRLGVSIYNSSRMRIRHDEVIGQVRLGQGATENSEFDHWNHVLQNPGQDYTMWHTLMEPDRE